MLLERCIFERFADAGTGTSVNRACISILVASGAQIIRNCLFLGGSYSIGDAVGDPDAALENCTFIGFTTQSAISDTDYTFKNCVAYSEFAGAVDFGTANASSTNNASGDLTAPGTGSVTGITTADFVDSANDDYRIDDTSALYGAGTDLTGTFTDDIRGTATRISTSPDIGAYKFDVVTKTLRDGTGDYSSFATWESNEQTDLVADGEWHVLECYNDWPTGLNERLVISGWNCDVGSSITVKAAAGNEHNGVIGGGFWWYWTIEAVEISTSNHNYIRFVDVEIASTSNASARIFRNGTTYNQIRRCILHAEDATTATQEVLNLDQVTMENTLVLSGGGRGCDVRSSPGSTVNNCTIIGTGDFGLLVDANCTMQNTVVYGYATEDVYLAAGTENNCATGDTSISGTGAVTGITTTDFNNYAGGDYAPSNGSALYDAGTDLSGTFTDDITGTTRPAEWDIGAYIAVTQTGGGWSITDVDLDESIQDGQTGVVVTISSPIAATGKKVWLEQGGTWVEQTVTAETTTTATITVTYGGVLSPGAATLYVRNPL